MYLTMTIILIKGNDLGLGAFAAYDLPANQCVGELIGPISVYNDKQPVT